MIKPLRRRTTYLLNGFAGFGYIGIAIVLALAASVLLYWYVSVNLIEAPAPIAPPTMPSDGANPTVAVASQFATILVTFAAVVASIAVVVLFPLLIGSIGNWVTRFILRVVKVPAGPVVLFVVKILSLVLGMSILIFATLGSGIAIAIPFLIFGSFTAGVTLVFIAAHFTVVYLRFRKRVELW